MQRKTLRASLAALPFVLCLALPAQAQQDPTAYNHDGFFLRMSLGFGPGDLTEKISLGGASTEYSLKGFTTMFELLLGGSPVDGLVIGGGLIGHVMSNPTLHLGGEKFETENTDITLSQLALFGVWYPDPQGGFNLLASLGYGGASVTVDNQTHDTDLSGLYFGIGAGYDFWIAEQWSIGPSLRLTYAALSGSEGQMEVRDRFFSPTLAISATYH